MPPDHGLESRLRIRLALLSWLTGAAAGLIRGWYGEGALPPLLHALVGLALVLVFTAGGAFLGLTAQSIQALFRDSDKAETPGDDLPGAMSLGAVTGAFLGLIVTLILGRWDSADMGTGIGAAIGTFLAVALEDTSSVLLRLILCDQRPDPPPAGDQDSAAESGRIPRNGEEPPQK